MHEDVGNLSIQLVDQTAQESLLFCHDHTVTAEYGTRDSRVGTILSWRIDGKTLKIYSNEVVLERLLFISDAKSSFVVQDAEGKTVTYSKRPRATQC